MIENINIKETDSFQRNDKNGYIIAMSGGVDSSVAVFLLQKRGVPLEGISLRLTEEFQDSDAKAAANILGIPHETLDLRNYFCDKIINNFISEYEAGRTPNPCITCNKYVKFKELLVIAEKKGYHGVATGHYARIVKDLNTGKLLLKKAKNISKDQSYVLYNLSQADLARVFFPLGELTKEEVRKIARDINLGNAEKSDSQDICFIPDGDYVDFIKKYKNTSYPAGDIIDTKGNVLGQHKGAICYTLGQRKGLGIAVGKPIFVCDKDMRSNTITVGDERKLFKEEVYVKDLNWIAIDKCTEPFKAMAKLRYSQKEAEVIVYPVDEDKIKLVFNNPQRAPAPGQAAVIYQNDIVVGGGTII